MSNYGKSIWFEINCLSYILADFMRPVVILGACGDLARLKLLDQMPDRFELPSKWTEWFSVVTGGWPLC